MDSINQFMQALAAETSATQRELPDANKVWLKAQWAAIQENEAHLDRRRSLLEAIPLALSVAGIVAIAVVAASTLGSLEIGATDLTTRVLGSSPPALIETIVLLSIGLGLPLMLLGATNEV